MPARVILPRSFAPMVGPNKLFVYGIFLGDAARGRYGMTNPVYATVPDYLTVGDYIVEAVKAPIGLGIQLTGLVVDVNPEYWEGIDTLEAAYDRIRVKTSNGNAWMYVQRDVTIKE